MKPQSIYQDLYTSYTNKTKQLKTKLSLLSWLRLFSFLLLAYSIYQSFVHQNFLSMGSAVIFLVFFIFSIKRYAKQSYEKNFYTALANINQTETAFLETNQSKYATGLEFLTDNHAYAYDLDIFAEGGLYAHINRCSTDFGKKQLAETLVHPNVQQINQRQEAIAELKEKLDFRQKILASGIINKTKNKELQLLLNWLQSSVDKTPILYKIAAWVMPFLCVGSYVVYQVYNMNQAYGVFIWSLVGNLIIVGSLAKKITQHIQLSNAANKLLEQFQKQIEFIEKENFQSSYVKELQSKFFQQQQTASARLHKIVYLLNQLETILNIFVSIVLNGFLLYHLRILISIGKWKKENAAFVADWLQAMGEFEVLNSYANFAYNNPQNCFPKLSAGSIVTAQELGHPLIHASKRINNDIDFSEQRFTILTGSNMSGKSTFLRTVGVNLILAKTGSVVCARAFIFYPFDVFVSMRINDSLQESESLFYAELKRLQSIVTQVQNNPKTFVILDEILRGTNSNDKRNGTISFIKNLMQYQPFGMIATHDTIVAELKNEMPELINNRCFESQIINDQLYFDYKIKEGVCTTLSASFLMKKMGIIQ